MKNLLTIASIMSFIIMSCESKKAESSSNNTPSVATPSAPPVDTLCFEYIVNKKDITTVQLIVKGDSVKGEMHWHPHEKDGAHGTLLGVKKGEIITADYSYMIEGSNQVEEVMFKLEGDKLSKYVGELTEKGTKIVIKDPSKGKYDEVYTKVNCSKMLKDE